MKYYAILYMGLESVPTYKGLLIFVVATELHQRHYPRSPKFLFFSLGAINKELSEIFLAGQVA